MTHPVTKSGLGIDTYTYATVLALTPFSGTAEATSGVPRQAASKQHA